MVDDMINGDWDFPHPKKESVDCNKCIYPNELTEMEKYECKICDMIFTKGEEKKAIDVKVRWE